MAALAWWVPALPGLGALVLIVFGRSIPRRAVPVAGCATVLGSFVLSLGAAVSLPAAGGVLRTTLFPWLRAGAFAAPAALAFDRLTAVMALVVTGVGFLIHLYSAGYMADEPSLARYFGQLNLFTFFMLVLVFAANLPLLFVGWEGVGLCSYLLIGFWFERPAAASAGLKAFLVNRAGDAAFIAGLLLLMIAAGTGDFAGLREAAVSGRLAPAIGLAGALLLLAGATGKSAQLPLHVWLPDAMQGPTPVSALIHAATMVTAGVYLVARTSFLYLPSTVSARAVALVGALTAVFAGAVALRQNDIKRVLAYSTISQIGYMFLGCGVGAFAAGIFHLVTHAFFKALLFLAAGSVIHALHGEQDLRRMGGLRRRLPVTWPTFLAGAAAIAGVPFLSGFFSKDAILTSALARGETLVYALGLAGAVLTAAYALRLTALVFLGEPRGEKASGPVHESPALMTVPLAALALFSVTAGVLGLPALIGGRSADLFGRWLAPALGTEGAAETAGSGIEALSLAASIAAAALGFAAAWTWYRRRGTRAETVPAPAEGRGDPVGNAYEAALVRPLVSGARRVYRRFDLGVVDAAVDGAAAAVSAAGKALSRAQSGWLKDYALWVLLAAVAILAWAAR